MVPPAGQAPVALLPAGASAAERVRMLRAILDGWEDDGHYALVDAVWDALAALVREAEERYGWPGHPALGGPPPGGYPGG